LEQIQTGKIEKWLHFFKSILEKDYQELEQTSDDAAILEEKEKDYITVLLGAVCQASYRLLQKFGNRKTYRKKPEFAQYYVENLAIPAMEAHLYIISKKEKFVGRKALYFSLRYIELFVQNKDTCKLIEEHMKTLLHDYLIPLMSMNVQDAIEFQNNAGESIRKELTDDPSHSDNCPKVAAKGLLVELCSYKPDSSFKMPVLLEDFLHLCVEHLNECKRDPTIDFRLKDATLFALYSICPVIEKHENLLEGLEDLLTEHVQWELSGQNDFLKARSMLCYNEITTRMDLEDKNATAEYWRLLFENTDKNQWLNIKVYALTCIRRVCSGEVGYLFFKDKIGALLEICLDVLDEFFIEDLIEALNEIVHVFYEQIIPYSIQVWDKLAEAYEDTMAQMGQDDIDMNDAKLTTTANGCIGAIFRVITSIESQSKENSKDVLLEIEAKVHNVLLNSLDPRFQDVHEYVLNCIAAFIYYSNTVTSNLWEMFPKLIEVLHHNLDKSCEYGLISPGISAIMNYMQKDPETFVEVDMQNGVTPFTAVVALISKTISLSHEAEDVLLQKTGSELVIGLLENLHGRINNSIPAIIELLVNEIQDSEDRCAKLLIIQALNMCFAYNTPLTFQILEEKQWTQGVFSVLFDWLPNVKYDFETQRMIIGLLKIVSCTECQLPDMVIQAMPQIFKEIVVLCQKSIYTREQKAKSPEEKDIDLKEKAYNILDDWSDEDEYDDDEEYDPDEEKENSEELYKSFTQDIDEVLEVKKVLETLDSNMYEAYFGKVSREDQVALQDCVTSPLVSS